MSSSTPSSSNCSETNQNGEEVELGKRNRKPPDRLQGTSNPRCNEKRSKAQKKKKKKSISTSSSKSQKIKTSSNSTRRKAKKQSLPTKEAKKERPRGEYEVLTDSEEVKVNTSKVESSNSKKGKKKRRKKRSGDSSSLKNPDSKASINLNKKKRKESIQKMAAGLNKLYGCYSSEDERAEKKKLMELMSILEGSTQSQLKEERKDMKSEKGEVKDERELSHIEVQDRFALICEEFIDGNHPTKILHKSWNEKFVKIMGSISDQTLRRQQMVMNLLTSADLTDDQRSSVFTALETNTLKKLPFLQMTEDVLPSCNPLEFDPDSLMKKADLKLRHNGISKSWNLITSASTPKHQFTKEEIMDYIDGDEDFNFLELYNGFVEFDIVSHFDFFIL